MSTEDITKTCNKKLSSHFQYQQLVIDGNKYVIGGRKINDCRQILLTDLIDFYEEKLSKKECMDRVEESNPLLPDCDIDEILDDLLLNIPKYTTSCSLQYIELENQIEGGRFWFRINLTKVDPQPFVGEHTEDFYASLSELSHRYNCLLDVVKKKDKEIDEYKAQGVKIVKKSIMTDPFNEELFETKLKKIESLDRLDIFLETMLFFNSLKQSNSKNGVKTNKLSHTESKTAVEVSNVPSTNKKTTVKRPSSSDIRCAVISKVDKKAKQSKKNSILKLI